MQLSGKQFGKGQRLHLFRSYLGSQIIIHNDLCTLDELNSFELQAQTMFMAIGCVPRTVQGLKHSRSNGQSSPVQILRASICQVTAQVFRWLSF